MKKFWKKYHKWVGLVFSFFILMFCFSGIILNHRKAFSSYNVSRSILPPEYRFKNWNNGIVKGTLSLPNGKVLAYGNAGVWQTDSCFAAFESLNEGLKKGADNRKISNVLLLQDSSLWCAGLYDLYKFDEDATWKIHPIGHGGERITDLTHRGDTLVVLTRSHLYESLPPYEEFVYHQLLQPEGYTGKVSLFRSVWLLHSGEMFGMVGKLFVDVIAVVIIVLCITGILFFIMAPVIKKRNKKKLPVRTAQKTLKYSALWHNRLGLWLLIPTVFLAVTGTFLRPPLMLPLVLGGNVSPIPGSALDSENPWNDKFRGIRWDTHLNRWLLSTSGGFYEFPDFHTMPVKVKKAPPVSPMGINVFSQCSDGEWLIGSFSGLFRWNVTRETVTDYFTGEPFTQTFGKPVGSVAVSGYSEDLAAAKEIIFDYGVGSITATASPFKFAEMPDDLRKEPMSLWNFALELHVGRCYYPLLGPLSSLFVFMAGTLFTLTLISGYIILHRSRKKSRKKKTATDAKTGKLPTSASANNS